MTNPDPRYKSQGAVMSDHPMAGSAGEQFDHDRHRQELWGDVREGMDADFTSPDARRSLAQSKYTAEQIRKVYRLGHETDLEYAEIAEEVEGMHPNTVGKIVRGDNHHHVTREVKL